MKARLTNRQRDWVRDSLAFSFERLGVPRAQALAIVTTGSLPMFVFVSRAIARTSEYLESRELTLPLFARAFAEWAAYKAGVRPDPDGAAESETEE